MEPMDVAGAAASARHDLHETTSAEPPTSPSRSLARHPSLDTKNSPRSEPRLMSARAQQLVPADMLADMNGDELGDGDCVIIACNILPVNIRRVIVDGATDFEIGWNHDHLLSKKKNFGDAVRVLWVGGVAIDDSCAGGLFDGRGDGKEAMVDEMEEHLLEQRLFTFNCHPVFVKPEVLEAHHQFCKRSLYPVLHSVVDVYGPIPTQNWNRDEQQRNWEMYIKTNNLFAQKIQRTYAGCPENTTIWIHNYQLMLTPSFLLHDLPGVCVCFFMHQPWPSSELFRTLSVREEIVRGLLNSSIIGFHSFDYARHFLTTCTRLLGVSYSVKRGGCLCLDYHGRHVDIIIDHVSIEPDMVQEQLNSAVVLSCIQQFQTQFDGKRVILAVDDLMRLSGITLKLLAFEQLLEDTPHIARDTLMIQIGVENFYERGSDFETVCRENAEIADRINRKHGPVVIYRRVATLPSAERLALMSVADIFINSAVRCGLNLKPFEFVFCNKQKNNGLLLLSEYNCAVRVLGGSLRINPFHVKETASAIERALNMDPIERGERSRKDLFYVTGHSTTSWVASMLLEMKQKLKREDGAHYSYVGYGFGLRFRVLRVRADFRKLDIQDVLQAYQMSSRRVIFLDYGGTLTGTSTNFWTGAMSKSGLTPKQHDDLEKISSDPRNTVFVVSGRCKEELEAAFEGSNTSALGVAAEHGYFYRMPQQPGSAAIEPESESESAAHCGWQIARGKFEKETDDSWRDVCYFIMSQYARRTQGSTVELKQSCVTWSYASADPEYSRMQASELKTHLESVMLRQGGFPVVIVSGDTYLEVRLKGVNKGELVLTVMRQLQAQPDGCPDFAICIGNDDHDEYMYSALHAVEGVVGDEETEGWYNCLKSETAAQPIAIPSDFRSFSCIVGRRATNARHYLEDVDETWELLRVLSESSARERRSRSLDDLSSIAGADANARASDGPSSFDHATMRSSFSAMPMVHEQSAPNLAGFGKKRAGGGLGGLEKRSLIECRTSVGNLAALAEDAS